MKRLDLGQMIQILANFGVIVGIVFVGIELNQNNELLSAEARATELSQETVAWGFVAESEEFSELLAKDLNNAVLTQAEEIRLNSHWMRSLYISAWRYHERPESTEWVNAQRKLYAAYPSFRNTWQGGGSGSRAAGKDNFDPGFVEFYEANVVNQD